MPIALRGAVHGNVRKPGYRRPDNPRTAGVAPAAGAERGPHLDLDLDPAPGPGAGARPRPTHMTPDRDTPSAVHINPTVNGVFSIAFSASMSAYL